MSRILGASGERWTLARAIDALGESARLAGRPSSLWIAGVFYPGLFLDLGLGLSWAVPIPESGWIGQYFASLRAVVPGSSHHLGRLLALTCAVPFLFPFYLPVFRWTSGLAALGASSAWTPGSRTPRLGDAWRRGKGLAWDTGGLYLQMLLLALAAAVVFLGPVLMLATVFYAAGDGPTSEPSAWLFVLSGPSTILVATFTLVVSVMLQLALHSLSQNRRGVASALVHAWRLLRQDPWASVRAVMVDGVMSTVVAVFLLSIGTFGIVIATIVGLLVSGFVGVTRACYWARAYRALGGLTPEDGVPGL